MPSCRDQTARARARTHTHTHTDTHTRFVSYILLKKDNTFAQSFQIFGECLPREVIMLQLNVGKKNTSHNDS